MNDSAKVLLAVIVGLAMLLPFASAYPDGLWHGLMSDYSLTAIENPYFSTLASGLAGILLVLVFTFLVGMVSTRER